MAASGNQNDSTLIEIEEPIDTRSNYLDELLGGHIDTVSAISNNNFLSSEKQPSTKKKKKKVTKRVIINRRATVQ